MPAELVSNAEAEEERTDGIYGPASSGAYAIRLLQRKLRAPPEIDSGLDNLTLTDISTIRSQMIAFKALHRK